jgi:hypothetical protein
MSTTGIAEYGPDNPRDWFPDHPGLTATDAPHETAGVLRIRRTGRPGSEIMKLLKLRGTALMNQMQKAMDDENRAARAGRPIFDSQFPKGVK